VSPPEEEKIAPVQLALSPTGTTDFPARTEEQGIGGMQILVAEDNKTNQLVVEKMLKKSDAELHFVANGALAIEAYLASEYDLILMDLSMPVMGGVEATRRIRQHEEDTGRTKCRIIALTANAQKSDMRACTEIGMNGFLSKPFRKHELLTCLGTMA